MRVSISKSLVSGIAAVAMSAAAILASGPADAQMRFGGGGVGGFHGGMGGFHGGFGGFHGGVGAWRGGGWRGGGWGGGGWGGRYWRGGYGGGCWNCGYGSAGGARRWQPG